MRRLATCARIDAEVTVLGTSINQETSGGSKGRIIYLAIVGSLILLSILGFSDIILFSIYSILTILWFIAFILYSVSVFVIARSKTYYRADISLKDDPPKVTIMLPLHKEQEESISKTLESIKNQTYPKELMEVLLVLEPDDEQTKQALKRIINRYKNDIQMKIVYSDGKKKIKGHALNVALSQASGEIIGVYDADDEFPPTQIEEVVKIFKSDPKCGAIGTKVYRYRKSPIGSLLNLEMVVWYDMYVPIFYKISKVALLSGEGLFLRRDVLERIGGYPEKLCEDFSLSIKLKELGLSAKLLESYVVELAPKTLKSLLKQRLRWIRGDLEALGDLLKSRVSIKDKVLITFLFFMPVLLTVGPIIAIFELIRRQVEALVGRNIFIMLDSLLSNPIYQYLSTLSLFFTFIYIVIVFFVTSRNEKWKFLRKYVVLLPLYWILLSPVLLYAPLLSPNVWYKTIRR